MKYVYLTHFHHDHIGGMLNGDSAVFANAEVYASKAEYDGWMAMDADKKAEVEKLAEAYKNRLHFFEFGDTLPGKVVALKAVGHTPGHTVYQAGKLLIIGDLIHGAALQLRHPEICASFDMNQEEAIQSRTQFLQYAKENGLTLAGMHLPAPAFMAPPFDF
ncbi:MAG TPA: MBL fold metallo-hydrolase [Candidatus Phocaeicola merdavium]|nr:MBL fold metallo-hydrolase [Candidatus Phocaeicola merdavium]